MSTNNNYLDLSEGHRQRLRSKFLSSPSSLSQEELLELLLTYAIPRKDVAPLAQSLVGQYGTTQSVLAAPRNELQEIEGIGESTVIFFKLITTIFQSLDIKNAGIMNPPDKNPQLNLFTASSPDTPGGEWEQVQKAKEKAMRVFANDEIQNALVYLPRAIHFEQLDAFQNHLVANLPYNSQATRERRARIIIERFFPGQHLHSPLVYYASNCSSTADLQPVVFYHTFKAEPSLVKVAEELVWPALPIGRIDREQLREFTRGFLPNLSSSSQTNMLRSIFYTYQLCSVGLAVRDTLRFNLRAGTLEGFLYILTSEYPQPGIYTFESLYASPLHRWLLWDREWLRQQLYYLRDLEIVSKIAEIDSLKQFTIELDQKAALERYFSDTENKGRSLRERPGGEPATDDGAGQGDDGI